MIYIHEENRIILTEEDSHKKAFAEITFPKISDHLVSIDHTYVDPSLRGQGIAGRLMEETVKQLRENRMTALVTCGYAVKWFKEHPEYRDVLEKQY